jgi:polysaccharide pyruvyl transferase WcaK-like protein
MMNTAFVVHSVAANGGDELLLRALKKGLKKYLNTEVSAVTTPDSLSCRFINEKCFLNSYVTGEEVVESKKVKSLLNMCGIDGLDVFRGKLGKIFPKVRQVRKSINHSDYAVLMPGGYINGYYGVENILGIVKRIRDIGKPIHLFCHSVGPFSSEAEEYKAREIFERCKTIILREEISASYVKDILGNDDERVFCTNDIAFAYGRFLSSEITFRDNKKLDNSNSSKKALLNFREWPYETEKSKILKLGMKVCKTMLKKGYSVKFISTCQGVEGYTDDSKISSKIYKKLKRKHSDIEVTVDSTRYSPKKLIKEMCKYDVYIGMRLHGAISSILAGTPAFNIGYEHKSKGIYDKIGIPEYTIGVTPDIEKIIKSVNSFVGEKKSKRLTKSKKALEVGLEESLESFRILREMVG